MLYASIIRPILVLPPTDIKIIECEQSEAEHDFYDALFRRSKVSLVLLMQQRRLSVTLGPLISYLWLTIRVLLTKYRLKIS